MGRARRREKRRRRMAARQIKIMMDVVAMRRLPQWPDAKAGVATMERAPTIGSRPRHLPDGPGLPRLACMCRLDRREDERQAVQVAARAVERLALLVSSVDPDQHP